MGVFLLGMHRGGTSATARVLNLLGLPIGDAADRMPAGADNPTGFWESRSLAALNDEILESLGGSWSAPPVLPSRWAWDERLEGCRERAPRVFRAAYGDPEGDWVWKDPRNCLTFPFWRHALNVAPAVVIVHRNPVEICASLEARNGFSKALGLALWERYLRQTLASVRGLPAFVSRYADLLREPDRWCAAVVSFLESRGVTLRDAAPAGEIRAFLDRTMSREARGLAEDRQASAEQRELCAAIDGVAGAHDSFEPPPLPEETVWVEPLFAERRGRGATAGALSRENRALATQAMLALNLLTLERDAARRELSEARAQALGLRETIEVLRRRVDDPSLRSLLGPWASRRWQVLGARFGGRSIRKRVHEAVGRSVSRLYGRLRWGRSLPALPDLSPAGQAGTGPSVSIVIPVFNKAEVTAACLEALRRNTDMDRVEIVVVDNASTDGTAALLDRAKREIRNLRVVRSPENIGFGPGCNLGAACAAGQTLVFLNNDTEPLPGWLEALTARLAADPGAGAVGARLVYPDGRLQEAGSIVWSDGSGWNYGRGDNPNLPAYTRPREVDYCSAACLAVRRELFLRLGGFDFRYAPAYYEDTDLCFQVREAGFSVWYEPAATVIHAEGATGGTDPSHGFKAFQERNRERFQRRWQKVLPSQWPPDPSFIHLAANRRLRLLMVVPHVPMPDFASGDLRLRRLVELLRYHFSITIFAHDPHPGYVEGTEDPYVGALRSLGVEVVFRDEDGIEPLLDAHDYDVAWLEFHGVAQRYLDVIRDLNPRAMVVVDSVDAHFAREAQGAYASGAIDTIGAVNARKKGEVSAYVRADLVLAVTEEDRKRIEAEAPGVATAVVPNVHFPVEGFRAERSGDFVLFVGGYRHPPNVDAVLYFAREVWPRIRERRPDLRFFVAGSLVPPEIQALDGADGIEVVGWVPSTLPYYRRALAAVAPLRYGAGMKGKIGEALSLGVPVVTTKIGAEGMELRHEIHALIADDAEGFAASVLRLCADSELAERLAADGKAWVERRWAPEIVNHEMLVALSGAIARRDLPPEAAVDQVAAAWAGARR